MLETRMSLQRSGGREVRAAPPPRLRVNEIFFSIQGESTRAGRPCIFVRLTGCDLRCVWCDTAYAFYEGRHMSLDEVHAAVARHPCRLVEFTGGEPMLQHRAMVPLMERFLREGYEVLIETHGGLDLSPLPAGVVKIMDLKCPESGEESANRYENLRLLSPRDELKFVLAGRGDYEWMKERMARLVLPEGMAVLVSPVWGRLALEELAAWILEDALPVRLQPQLHKILWGEKRGV
jgi:7-carboxy-7-deazaguanine synthase